MQKLIIVFLAGILIFCMGCQEKSVEPELSDIQKGVISLPEKSSLSAESDDIATQLIDGKKGGKLSLSDSYKSGYNKRVTIDIDVTFPPGSFKGWRFIIASVSDFAGVDFFPDMVFDIPVTCDVKFTGLDLKNVDDKDVKFGYLAPNGTFEPCKNDGITINKVTGTLTVNNADLYHFSRYCFFH